MAAAIEVDGLTQTYRTRKGFFKPTSRVVEAVRGVSFTVEPGELLGLLGPNEFRRLLVSTDVDPTRRLLMEAHIKIEQGGTPCPRIHFDDDTRGETGKIHIGWFGDHLDSRAKS